MELDYHEIGKRIAKRRAKMKMTQAKVAEFCGISEQYVSNIERSVSIPSTEVIVALSHALETTPDEFLVGTARHGEEHWKDVAEQLRALDEKQLKLIESLIHWAAEQQL